MYFKCTIKQAGAVSDADLEELLQKLFEVCGLAV
jgi:hypothetical protein